jgi:hypothetical protein
MSLSSLSTGDAACPPISLASPIQPKVRFLGPQDLDTLLALENTKWDERQAASRDTLLKRLLAHPRLCIGAFDPVSGAALASLFMKPMAAHKLHSIRDWESCAAEDSDPPVAARSLFGISLSSIDPKAVDAIMAFFWPHALKGGWREVILGSPIPGLSAWRRANPDAPVEQYVQSQRSGLPLDPQLRYYHRKGFDRILRVVPQYFPHPASLDFGVLLRGKIPLAGAAPLWKLLPLSWLFKLRGLLFRML